MALKVLLFDVDGTLVLTEGAGRRALDRAFERLYGVYQASDGVVLSGRTDSENFEETYRKHFAKPPTRAERSRLEREYLRCLPDEVKDSVRRGLYVVVKGVRPLLARLAKRKNLLVGLGTGNFEDGARLKLAPSGLNKFLKFGGFGGDAMHRHLVLKTGVRRARRLAGGVRIRSGDVYVVGDTPLDVLAARRAGYRAAAVSCGFATVPELRRAQPEFMAKDFSDLRAWLDWLGLNKKGKATRRRRA